MKKSCFSIAALVVFFALVATASGEGLSMLRGDYTNWYLPAGAADGFFNTYILVANPSSAGTWVEVSFHDEEGPIADPENLIGNPIWVPGNSRLTVNMSSALEQAGYPISTKVVSLGDLGPEAASGAVAHPIFCERATYGGPTADWLLSHSSIGTPHALYELYFAEGATHYFDFDIILFNPSSSIATVDLRFSNHDGDEWDEQVTVNGYANLLVDVNAIVGEDPHINTHIVSDLPIAAERVMAWPLDEADAGYSYIRGANDAHATISIGVPAGEWLFAEGATHMFDCYILLSNFGDETATAELTFSDPGGVIGTYQAVIEAGHRYTVKANDVVGEVGNVSVLVEADLPVYAERAMYWNGDPGWWEGGHCSVGVPVGMQSAEWLVPEGATHIFDHYVLVYNPGTEPVEVTARFLGDEGQIGDPEIRTVAPQARETFRVHEILGRGVEEVATELTADGDIVVERAMYHPGELDWRTGHSTMGFSIIVE